MRGECGPPSIMSCLSFVIYRPLISLSNMTKPLHSASSSLLHSGHDYGVRLLLFGSIWVGRVS